MSNIKNDIKELLEYLDSEEGKKSAKEYFGKINQRKKVEESQIDRLNKKTDQEFIQFVEKVISKYDAEEYWNRWYSRGMEPPHDLFWFLYHYAIKYGRECSEGEWDDYGCDFTSDLRFCNGYYFERMDSQGSVVLVHRENEKRLK